MTTGPACCMATQGSHTRPLCWTMSCGSGKAVADLMLGREPEIDLRGNEYRW